MTDNCIECKWYKDTFNGCQFMMGLTGKKRLEKHASLRDEVKCKMFEERSGGCWDCFNNRYEDHRHCAPYNEDKTSRCENWVHHIEGKSW